MSHVSENGTAKPAPSSVNAQQEKSIALLSLAERVEKAEGPDRELDAEIGAVVRYHPYGPDHWIGGSDIEFRALGRRVQAFFGTGESCDDWAPAQYTASLDSALTLVPDGKVWRVCTMTGRILALICDPNAPLIAKTAPRAIGAGTPALALCSAALRARAAI